MTHIFEQSQLELRSNPNMLINGDFSVWQRGVAFTAGWRYTADRWLANNASVTRTHSNRYGSVLRVKRNYSDGGLITQCVELQKAGSNYSMRPFQLGKEYTITALVNTRNKIKPSLSWGTGSVAPTGKPTSTVFEYKGSRSNAQDQYLSWTFTLDNQSAPADSCLRLTMKGETANELVDFYDIKLEFGSVATPFVAEDSAINLAKCQRYYYKHLQLPVYGAVIVTQATTSWRMINAPFPQTMRAAPNVTPSFAFNTGAQITPYATVTHQGINWQFDNVPQATFVHLVNYEADAEF